MEAVLLNKVGGVYQQERISGSAGSRSNVELEPGGWDHPCRGEAW